jgi:hypothetical protein
MLLPVSLKKSGAIFLSALIFSTGCTSTTRITSVPPGAKLSIDGEYKGTTPYLYTDSKISGYSTDLKFELEGYETRLETITKDEEIAVGPAIAGFFLLFPWIWVMKYKPAHEYMLTPVNSAPRSNTNTNTGTNTDPGQKSKADRLRELKQLLDEGLITKEDYEKKKQEILDEK